MVMATPALSSVELCRTAGFRVVRNWLGTGCICTMSVQVRAHVFDAGRDRNFVDLILVAPKRGRYPILRRIARSSGGPTDYLTLNQLHPLSTDLDQVLEGQRISGLDQAPAFRDLAQFDRRIARVGHQFGYRSARGGVVA